MAFSFAAGTSTAGSPEPREPAADRSGPIERARATAGRIARIVNLTGIRGGQDPPRFDPAVIEDAVAAQLYGDRSGRGTRRQKNGNRRRA